MDTILKLVHWIMEDHPVGLGCGVDTGGELCSTTQDLVTCLACRAVFTPAAPIGGEANLVRQAMEVAADRYGGTERIFNAAGFSQAFSQLSGVPGTTLDGKLVRAILSGRPDCALLWGGSHFRVIQPVAIQPVALKVSVVAYQGKIVICPQAPEQGVDKDVWWPTGGGKGGCVLVDSRRLLGVSEEALLLMQSVVRNHDAVGDLGWWKCDDGKYAFSWWGPIFRIVDPKEAEADRDFRVWRDECTIIPNQVPEAAKLVIDAGSKECFWAEPIYIDRPGDDADENNVYEADGGKSRSL